jgi:hypothetical protein
MLLWEAGSESFYVPSDPAQQPLTAARGMAQGATLLLVQGVSPRVVMDVLGHSEIGMTTDTYSHVIPELQTDAAQTMELMLRRSPSSERAR